MACGCESDVLTDEQRYAVIIGTPCESISVDLLKMYKNPIDCYLKYGLWGSIESSQLELQNASNYLKDFIIQKTSDNTDCTGIESLVLIRVLVSKIIQKGACL